MAHSITCCNLNHCAEYTYSTMISIIMRRDSIRVLLLILLTMSIFRRRIKVFIIPWRRENLKEAKRIFANKFPNSIESIDREVVIRALFYLPYRG